ncbi:hypothetical protein EYC84_007826 [Monilinia fructicola]|uniref:Uncharacterized protein n=1 Tax=Monilinia fructicola TaxID=38448 RepID=A0A5M9JM62_MONFR|nr:hypothetical protein EYC84_007826 [Monilinia fructicola]
MPPKTTKKIAHLNANKSKDSNLTTSDSESDGAPLTKRGKSRSQPKSDLDTPPKRRGPGRPRHSKSIVVDSDESMKDNDEEPAESSKAPNKRKRQATKPSMEGKAVAQSSDDEMPDVHGETISDSNADYDSVEWTEEDQILLDFTHDYEISLWRRTKSIFNCAPFDLFPKGIKAANDDWSGYDYNAWEIWNKESKRYLPTMDEFEDYWQKSSVKDMKVPRDMVLQWKKDWILKKRIEAKNERDGKKNQSPKEDEDVF